MRPPGVSQLFHDLFRQVRAAAGWYVTVFVLLSVLTGVVVHLHHNTHILVTELFEDPVEYGVLPLHLGIYSYLSGISMIVAGAILIFGAWVVTSIARQMRAYAAVFGTFLTWLGFDDMLMIHEWVGLRLAWLVHSDDVPSDRQWVESYVFAGYGLAWVGILMVFRQAIARTSWLLLMLTFLGFGTSVILDLSAYIGIIPTPNSQGQATAFFVVEDMGKLAGAFFALAYALSVASDFIRSHATGAGRVAEAIQAG